MSLSDFLVSGAWAISPEAADPLFQLLATATTPGADQVPQTALASSAQGSDHLAEFYTVQDGVAVISVNGVIHRSSGSFLWFFWSGQDHIRACIDAAMADDTAHSVLLSFNSPGGVASGAKELADYIASQTAKPVYAYADGLCASAAYWLASATGRVYAPRTATIGSIGVLHMHCDRSAANAARGLRVTYITGGAWKASGNPDQPLSGADQARLQETVSQLHEIFRADVAAHMDVDAADPKAWGDGQIFLADAALEVGLVSGIVTDRDALVARINKEIRMDKEQLAKAHPDLFTQIQEEAKAEARAEAEKAQQAALSAAAATTQALVRVVAGDDAAAQVAKLSAAGFTAEQVEALAPMIASVQLANTAHVHVDAKGAAEGQPETPKADAGKGGSGQEEILAALRNVTPAPVNTSVTPDGKDPVQAAIDQISSVGL